MQPDRDRLGSTFDTIAEQYERARPNYPPALFADLADIAELRPGDRILEVGCGTGQATRGLLNAGWRVVAIERGPALAAVARRVLTGLGDVRVEATAFEHWQSSEPPFDAVVAATSWHWLDPLVSYRRAADLLRDDGSLVLIGTQHVLPDDGDSFFIEAQPLYQEADAGSDAQAPPHPDTVKVAWVDELVASGMFQRPVTRRYVRTITYTANQYVELLGTYSNHLVMPGPVQARLYDGIKRLIASRPGGTVTKHYRHDLVIARRR